MRIGRGILGDDSEDYMVKCCVKWFHKLFDDSEKAHPHAEEEMIKQMIPIGPSLLIRLLST